MSDDSKYLGYGLVALAGILYFSTMNSDKKTSELKENYDNNFYSRGDAMPIEPPRASPMSVLSQLKGSSPDVNTMGMNFGNLVGKSSDSGINQGWTQQQLNQAVNDRYLKNLEYPDADSMLPAGDMENSNYGDAIADPNTYIYDRLIVGYSKNRNLESADFIRGDLFIPTDGNKGWFRPSVKYARDLRAGAIGNSIGMGNQLSLTDSSDYGISGIQGERRL